MYLRIHYLLVLMIIAERNVHATWTDLGRRDSDSSISIPEQQARAPTYIHNLDRTFPAFQRPPSRTFPWFWINIFTSRGNRPFILQRSFNFSALVANFFSSCFPASSLSSNPNSLHVENVASCPDLACSLPQPRGSLTTRLPHQHGDSGASSSAGKCAERLHARSDYHGG